MVWEGGAAARADWVHMQHLAPSPTLKPTVAAPPLRPLPTPPFIQVGTRYQLKKLLGEGSFSQVALALDTETGEQVRARRGADHAWRPGLFPFLWNVARF